MTIVIKKGFREVVKAEINGVGQSINVKTASLDDLRGAINPDLIVGARAVMYGMARLAHFPHHATQYDMARFVQKPFTALLNEIERGAVDAYCYKENSHYWEDQYIKAKDFMEVFDVPSMPSADIGHAHYSMRDSETDNRDRKYALDLRRAFLVSIGEAKQHEESPVGGLIKYRIRTEEEWERHFEGKESLEQMRKPITDGMKVWEGADRFHEWLCKHGVSHDPDNLERNKSPKQKTSNKDDDFIM